MGRTRDVSKILTSNTSILSLASASTTYATKASTGLTLINTTSFSGVASFSFPNDSFTSTYENYKIVMYLTQSAGSVDLQFRGRVAGSDNTTANYNHQIMYAESTTIAGFRGSGATAMVIGQIVSTNASNAAVCDIIAPKLTRITTVMGQNFYPKDNASFYSFAGNFALTTSFDSCSILVPSGNITGKASLYGYNK